MHSSSSGTSSVSPSQCLARSECPGLDSFRPSTGIHLGLPRWVLGLFLKAPDLILRPHDSLGAASPVRDRAGLHSLPAALLPTLFWADGLMMIQLESLGLLPSVVVVPQDSPRPVLRDAVRHLLSPLADGLLAFHLPACRAAQARGSPC